MASQAIFAKNSKLQRKDPGTGVLQDIPQLRIIPTPSATQLYVDTTNHDSPGGFEENEPTIKTGDELAFTLVYHFDIPLHPQLWDDFVAQTKLSWRVLFPGGVHGWDFVARVSKFNMPLDFAGIAVLDGSLKATGEATRF